MLAFWSAARGGGRDYAGWTAGKRSLAPGSRQLRKSFPRRQHAAGNADYSERPEFSARRERSVVHIAVQETLCPPHHLASVPWFLQDISTYGIGIFTPTIMAAMALGTSASFIAKDMGATEGAAAVDMLLVVGFILAIVLVITSAGITLQIVGFLGMALGLLMVAASSLFPAASAVTWA